MIPHTVRSTLRLATAVALLAAAPTAHAYASAAHPKEGRPVGVLVRMNMDFGGEKFGTLTWADGDTTDLRAGQLFTFSAGLLYRAPTAPWALEGTVGYKFDKANAANGSVGFARVPIDVVASWLYRGHRLGAGPTLHLAPSYTCELEGGLCGASPSKVSYDTAVGGIAQYAYGFSTGASSGVELGVRYTVIRYAAQGLPAIDGNGVGFLFGGWF